MSVGNAKRPRGEGAKSCSGLSGQGNVGGKTTLNGHALPERLIRLCESRVSPNGLDAAQCGLRLGIDICPPHGLLLGIEGIARQLGHFLQLVEEDARTCRDVLGIRSSQAEGQPIELPWIDIDKALPIYVSTWDDSIWLDYRTTPPRVLKTAAESSHPFEYVEIASSFEELAGRLLSN